MQDWKMTDNKISRGWKMQDWKMTEIKMAGVSVIRRHILVA